LLNEIIKPQNKASFKQMITNKQMIKTTKH